jgi:cyclic beta-1,2-glucan synthetase
MPWRWLPRLPRPWAASRPGDAARAMLELSRGPIEAPIRAEVFGAARFQQHGRSLAATHQARPTGRRIPAFFPRTQDSVRVLREAHRYLGSQARAGQHISPAGEWLLDNFHVVLGQVKEIHEGMPRRYFRDLPVLVDQHLAGLPRIYGVAWAFVAHTDSAFNEELLSAFLTAYQESRPLTLGELWALPTTLRVVLVENLRRLAERVAAAKAARELANRWADDLDDELPLVPDDLYEGMRPRGVADAFALQLALRLQDHRLPTHEVLRLWLERVLPDRATVQLQQQAEQAADNLSMSNAIRSLRMLGDADWRELIAQSSRLMRAMQQSALFRAERDDTQDSTLRAIEKLSRRSAKSETEVARTLLQLTQDAGDSAHASPGYWLHGRGRAVLRKALALPPRTWPSREDLRRSVAVPLYLGLIGLGSAALTAWFVLTQSAADATPLMLALLAVLVLFPASETVIALLHRLVSESMQPQRLPRLAWARGIPAEHRVMVVVPALLTSVPAVQALADALERHYLANPEPQAQFALLSDPTDADQAQRPTDAALLDAAVQALARLNQRYPAAVGQAPRFLLLHRERRWCDTEQRWIGWERKRGKLEQLIDALATGVAGAFVDQGALSQLAPGTRYVLTLDSDTQIPPGVLRELVGVAAHPVNQPRVDAERRCVTAGYGILQPHVVTPLPTGDESLYHALFAGHGGIDPYAAATSEVYQDITAEGSFVGKGLLNVEACHRVLSGRLPSEQVLSHDLIEGSIVRCAGVSDVSLVEEAPMHPDVAGARIHRWTRGDWQLLPCLLNARRFGLRAIHRWKLLDNLRRSLVAPLSLLLLLVAMATPWVAPGAAWLLVAGAFGAGPLMGAIAALAPSRDGLALLHFFRQALINLWRTLLGIAWHVAQLLSQSMLHADAIARALYRMLISRRHLLQWTTAAAAQAAARTDLAGLAREHASVSVAALGLWLALLAAGTPTPWLALGTCLVWGASPLWTWWASRPRTNAAGVLSAKDGLYLHGVARDTWTLFEQWVGEEDNHLPPDNVQTAPETVAAHRTSPTNIGLYLLAVACARRFGWIDAATMLARLEATLATLARLTRHHGHFLNWTDTRNLQPLLPAYVSTVDSGNLCGAFMTTAQALRELADEGSDAARAARAHTLADAFDALALEPDFAFLYDARRRLFHIGYRIAEQELDTSYYDLLASEARFASLWAIAKGDVPANHWLALGRPWYATGSHVGLRSWSGSMFEHLMPSLLLDEPRGSALHSATQAAVREQMAFGREHGVPWGVSESAYAARDHTMAYQYGPQGVPRLALRRTPPDELVVAPYATALAALIVPHEATQNLRRLEHMQARHAMGFIEALDFTPERRAEGGHDAAFAPVMTFMAHHQGMQIVALANVLLDASPRRWAMSHPRLGAVAPLLSERVPREVSSLLEPPVALRADERATAVAARRDIVPGAGALQPTQLLSNGRYSVALRANGAGWSRLGDQFISRWRDDALRDAYGSFFFIRREPGAEPVSLTQHPAPDARADYQCSLHADRVCLDARWPDLESRCTVWVSPEDDAELRQVELRNLSGQAREIELISYFEVSLMDARGDESHPAFANLFVRAAWDATDSALHLERLPRLATEQGLHAVHFLAHSERAPREVRVQTDRARWIGRNRDVAHPLALFDDGAAEVTTGLDPIASISVRIELPAHGSTRLTWITAAGASRAALETLVDKYLLHANIERSSLMSATLAAIRLRELQLKPEQLAAIQTLTTPLVLTLPRPAPRDGGDLTLGHDAGCDRRLLWRFGISGDRPIILVTGGAVHGLGLMRTLAQALRLWSWSALACDLVVINNEPASYLMPLQLELAALRDRVAADAAALPGQSARSSLHVLRAAEVSAEERTTLQALARIRLTADGRPLAQHVQDLVDWHDAALDERQEQSPTALPQRPPSARVAQVTSGEFDAGSGDFHFHVDAAQRPARPWVNVLANPNFGTQVSEAGGGHTWGANSRLNQLSAWSNDPVTDAASEWLLLQDLRSGEVWNVAAGLGAAPVRYRVRHGQGITRIEHAWRDLEVAVSWCVDPVLAVKQVELQVTNRGPRTARLRVLALVEWIIGAARGDRQTLRSACESMSNADGAAAQLLLATQRDAHAGFGGASAFVACRAASSESALLAEWTCDRREWFDARGRLVAPEQLNEGVGLGHDPCASVAAGLIVPTGGSQSWTLLVGYGNTPAEARATARQALWVEPEQRLQQVRRHWDGLLGGVTVKTPDPLFDAMVNRWLLYQTVACRLWARAGFYQAGGAFGFRDQLQDAMALAGTQPQMLRAQIVLAASRQFAEGDVQHWWHAPTGAGVRTHFSDDLLWLPFATAHYLRCTEDTALLDEAVPFLEGQAIPAGAEDAYFVPARSEQQASLYEHCARTIDRSLAVGAHGLPLMGTGDWNDGMNRVGHQGRGESVWLGWFLISVVEGFAPLARARGDGARAQLWQDASAGWRRALRAQAWDGRWFKRAFFDDGTPLGSHANEEARIDLIAQAWSVLSDAATPAQQALAMQSVDELLIDREHGLVRLLDPPLVHARPEAGYIQAYPPGIRENGGQYSHGAVWALMAQARRGQADLAWRSFTAVSPAHRSRDPHRAAAYQLEPYAVAGDIYSQPPYAGRGGWSWYTGSAAWLHRAALESICGLQWHGERVALTPCLPSAWPQIELRLRKGALGARIVVCRESAAEALAQALADGALRLGTGEWIVLSPAEQERRYVVVLAHEGPQPAPHVADAQVKAE